MSTQRNKPAPLTDLERGFGIAGDWLIHHHERACTRAVETGFFRGLEDEPRALIDRVPEDVRNVIQVNMCEWLVADSRLEFGRGRNARTVAAVELVLGPDGPLLSPGQRREIAGLAERRLGLYEVMHLEAAGVITLLDQLDSQRRAYRVHDHEVVGELAIGDALGARLLTGEGDTWRFSPAFYPLSTFARDTTLVDFPRVVAAAEKSLPRGDFREAFAHTTSEALITAWLLDLLAPHVDRPELSPQVATEAVQLVYDEVYARWAHEPIPMLGGLTPRQAIREPVGRARVIALIQRYERGEQDRARDAGRKPADLGFLWEQLGLPREVGPQDRA